MRGGGEGRGTDGLLLSPPPPPFLLSFSILFSLFFLFFLSVFISFFLPLSVLSLSLSRSLALFIISKIPYTIKIRDERISCSISITQRV